MKQLEQHSPDLQQISRSHSPQINERRNQSTNEIIRSQTPQQLEQEKQKLQEYKRQSINQTLLAKLRRQSQDDAKLVRSSHQNLDKSIQNDLSMISDLEKKVKNMNISDYFNGSNKLRIKSALRDYNTKSTQSNSILGKVRKQNESKQYQKDSNEFIQQIKELTKNLAYCRPEEIIPVILNTDKQKLKQDLIDQEKALIVMKNMKEQDGEAWQEQENQYKSDNIEGGSLLFSKDKKSEKRFQEHIKQQQWNSFLEYIKDKPDKVLQMVPSSHNTLEHSHEQLILDQQHTKRPTSRFQTLGSQYLAALELSRPNSSNQAGLLSQSGIFFMKPGARQISTAVNVSRPRRGIQSQLSHTAMSFKQAKGVGIKSHYQSTGRVNQQSSQLSNSRYINKLAKSRPSYMSTQYTNFLQGEDNRIIPQNNQSSIFSNQDSSLIIQQNNIQGGNHSHIDINEQSFRLNQSQDRLHEQLHIPIIQSDEFENRPTTSMGTTYPQKSLLLLDKKEGRMGNLLQSVKFPEKERSPLVKLQGQVNDLSQVDTSIISIQQKAKRKISLFERANKKLDEIQKRLLKKKWQGYSLANDLAVKLKVEEWKQNPNFNKFQRQINQNGPLRQANLIDWKQSILKQYVEQNKINFNWQDDDKYFKSDEIEYMINLFKYSSKSFTTIEQLKPVFNKSLATLEKIMEELSIGYLYDRISVKIIEISPENTTKVLIRCKMMLQCRTQIIKILQIIDIRETKMKELNYLVIKGDQKQIADVNASQSSLKSHLTKSNNNYNDNTKQTNRSGLKTQKNVTIKSSQESQQNNNSKQRIQEPGSTNFSQLLKMRSSIMKKEESEDLIREKVKELNDITDLFVNKVRDLIQVKRLFGAHFIYDGMDYIKVVVNEMKQLRQILTMFGIDIVFTQSSSHSRILETNMHTINNDQNEDLVSQIRAGSFMLNNPLTNLTQDNSQLNQDSNMNNNQKQNNSIAKAAQNAQGYNNSIFEEGLQSKDTTIKIDNQSSIVYQHNDSMMVGDIGTGKHLHNNISYFGDDYNIYQNSNSSPFKSKFQSENTTLMQ